jgi:hypothetical protein
MQAYSCQEKAAFHNKDSYPKPAGRLTTSKRESVMATGNHNLPITIFPKSDYTKQLSPPAAKAKERIQMPTSDNKGPFFILLRKRSGSTYSKLVRREQSYQGRAVEANRQHGKRKGI